jgi:hypothetical protein
LIPTYTHVVKDFRNPAQSLRDLPRSREEEVV